MSTEGKDAGSGMGPGDDEALWQLLGRALRPEASPFFARRVLREVALDEENRGRATGGVSGWLAGVWQTLRGRRPAAWPAAAVIAVFWLSVVLMTNRPAPGPAAGVARQEAAVAVSRAPAASEDVPPQDVEVIADLDNLIAHEENRLWTDDAARF